MQKKIESTGFRFDFVNIIDAFNFDLNVRDLYEYPDAHLSAVDVWKLFATSSNKWLFKF